MPLFQRAHQFITWGFRGYLITQYICSTSIVCTGSPEMDCEGYTACTSVARIVLLNLNPDLRIRQTEIVRDRE